MSLLERSGSGGRRQAREEVSEGDREPREEYGSVSFLRVLNEEITTGHRVKLEHTLQRVETRTEEVKSG